MKFKPTHYFIDAGTIVEVEVDWKKDRLFQRGYDSYGNLWQRWNDALVKIEGSKENSETDSVVEAVRELLLSRSQVGIKKYGVTLATAELSEEEILQHALEEALDLANYLQTRLMKIRGEIK